MLTHGSLFAGMGGLDLAIADVFGAGTAWVSDVDPGANAILAHRYPDAPNLGDITRIDWAAVPRVDIISGGSPCQDLSHAGRRAGMTEGTRSNLWVSMREAIATIRPTWVVWENVRGAMSAEATSSVEQCPGCMGDTRDRGPSLRALGRVLGDLADLGYDAQWHGLRAADVGACHGRWRVFVLAYTHGARLQGQPDSQGTAPAGRHGHPVAGAGGPDLTLLPTPAASVANDGEGPDTWMARRERVKLTAQNGNGMGMPLSIAVRLLPTPTTEPATGNGHARNLGKEVRLLPTPRATDGTKGGPNRRGSSGDLMLPSAVVQLLPTPASSDANGAGAHGTGGADLRTTVALLPTPRTRNNENRQSEGYGGTHGNFYGLLTGAASWGEYAAAIARHEQAFGRPAPAPTEPGPKGNPRLSARFVEWMMMLPAGWVTDTPGITRNEALKALGNGVVPAQAAHALRVMLDRIDGGAAA